MREEGQGVSPAAAAADGGVDITCPAKSYLASSSREATCAGATFAKSHLASSSRGAQLEGKTGASSSHGATCAGSACPAKSHLWHLLRLDNTQEG